MDIYIDRDVQKLLKIRINRPKKESLRSKQVTVPPSILIPIDYLFPLNIFWLILALSIMGVSRETSNFTSQKYAEELIVLSLTSMDIYIDRDVQKLLKLCINRPKKKV